MRVRLKVKEIAQRKGVTMTRLGRMADLDYKTMQRVFHKPEIDFTISTLAKLATALQVHIYELIEELPDNDEFES